MRNVEERLRLILKYCNLITHTMSGIDFNTWDSDRHIRGEIGLYLTQLSENVKAYAKVVGINNLENDYPSVEWKKIIRFRDLIVHNYEKINKNGLYIYATHHVPELLSISMQIIKCEQQNLISNNTIKFDM